MYDDLSKQVNLLERRQWANNFVQPQILRQNHWEHYGRNSNIISKNFNTKAEIFYLILAEICLEHSVTYCHMPSKINNPLKYESVPWTLKSFVTPHQPLKNDDHFIFKAGPHLDKCKLESWGLTHFATIFTLFWSKISESMILERIMYVNFSRWVRKNYLFVILHLKTCQNTTAIFTTTLITWIVAK